MLKRLLVMFFILFSLSFGDTGSIAVFNTLRLGKTEKDYNHLARAVKPFDIVGLVEVMDKRGVFQLLRELEKIDPATKWDYHISPYGVGADTYKEYYAYIYKKEKVSLIEKIGFFPDYDDKLIREPYGVTFKIENFDFTFVLMHSRYGKKVSQRQFEANELVNVYNYFQNYDENEQDIIIGGDFNLPADDSAFSSLLNHKDDIIYALSPSIKTTIGTKGFANSYDNFFLSKKYTTEFKGESGALDITNGDYIKTRKEVSDHIPVFILVDTEKDDD